MKTLISALLIVCLLTGCPPTPDVTPDVPDGRTFGLEGLASTIPDPSDRTQLAAICDEFGRLIVVDGEQAEPAISTSAGMEHMLERMSGYAYRGKRITSEDFRERLESVLESELETETEGRELTPELRETAGAIFRAAARFLRE